MPAAAQRLGTTRRLRNRADRASASSHPDRARSRNRPSDYVDGARSPLDGNPVIVPRRIIDCCRQRYAGAGPCGATDAASRLEQHQVTCLVYRECKEHACPGVASDQPLALPSSKSSQKTNPASQVELALLAPPVEGVPPVARSMLPVARMPPVELSMPPLVPR
jgi:hypothetical protein